MLVGEQIIKKEFIGKTKKAAYLKACKYVAQNIIGVNNCNNITYKIVKDEKMVTKVVLYVYVMVDEQEIKKKNCDVCMEVNSLFYMKARKHQCESCKILPYRERIKQGIEAIKNGMKGSIL